MAVPMSQQLRTRNNLARQVNQTASQRETARHVAEIARHTRSFPETTLRQIDEHLPLGML